MTLSEKILEDWEVRNRTRKEAHSMNPQKTITYNESLKSMLRNQVISDLHFFGDPQDYIHITQRLELLLYALNLKLSDSEANTLIAHIQSFI